MHPMTTETPFSQFQQFLREMFQFDHNELDFGLFKVLRLKRSYIEQFISGDGERDLRCIVSRELQAIRSADDADERQWLANRCELLGIRTKTAWEAAVADMQNPNLHESLRQVVSGAEMDETRTTTLERLDRWLQAQQHSTGHLEAQLYNYLLNFFELYYQNGDFGYNSRAASAFKVPKLTSQTKKAFKVDSFILLRKSSPLGTANGELYDLNDVKRLEDQHILHLNWAPADDKQRRVDEDGDTLPHPPDGRCYMERMLTCAGLLTAR